ncbi:flagellar hook-length control protein FliK [Enterovibrio sp. ZSDZ42]|uniref:Flagellar hook-length control protein FliK n=1 Tax=Enterovibrio gelatinilyticus TaxID=2899819 RepID=A0ABT5R246_9GAMM|nr:flagellar hook-length control protein FliK [Enterovibrio sp. ZSDZ42]MDD1793572.1 flagellar hook-length control protein FliK [Enterovibrio sp. ZSDZ42]
MQISLSAPKGPSAAVAAGTTISANNSSTSPHSGVESSQPSFTEQANAASNNDVSHQGASQKPNANHAVENGESTEQSQETQAAKDELTDALEVAFPQLSSEVHEQISQWMLSLQQGDMSPADLMAKLQQQLTASGVVLPAPLMSALEGVFNQVARGELSLSQLADALPLVSRTLRQTTLDGFAKQFLEQAASQGSTQSSSSTQSTHVNANALNGLQGANAQHDAPALHVDVKPEFTLRQAASMPEFMLSINDVAPERMLMSGLQSLQANVRAPAQNLVATSSTTAPTAQQLSASVDITQPEWGRELVDQLRARLRFNSQDNVQLAHVRLDPPELGKLDITLRMEGDKLSVHIAAAHPQLREALSAHADRLRFDIEQSQLQLADVSVSSGLQQDQGQSQSEQGDNRTVMSNHIGESSLSLSSDRGGLSRYESVV